MHQCIQRTTRYSSDAPRAKMSARSGHDLPPILRMQRAIGNRAVNRLIQRQLDLDLDPCVTIPGVGEVCGSDAAKACEKIPSLPKCSKICKMFGCKKSNKPPEVCVPPWKTGTSRDFAGQCCLGTERKENCCPPDRVALASSRCCVGDEVVIDNKCVKSSDIPPGPFELCMPQEKTTTGKCCVAPLVPDGPICVIPKPPAPPKPPPAPLPIPKPFEIFFDRDRPESGESAGPALAGATPEGDKQFKALVDALNKDSTLRVHLSGKTSPEGDAAHNVALGERRARLVKAALIDAGIDESRVTDPASGTPAGCVTLEPGLANCHAKNASGPRDRQTRVQVFR
jgi:OmpA family protein